MGHAAPRNRHPAPIRPPAPPRLVPPHDTDDLIALARAEYVHDRIDLEAFEHAVAHILAGGRGTDEFPYLPIFSPGWTEAVSL